jgi:VanZ family protein
VLGIGSLHSIPTPDVSFQIDKVGHFAMYAALGALAALGWARNMNSPHFALVILLAMCVGATDEIHQRYVAGRTSDIADFAADTAGILIGFTFAARFNAASGNGNGTQ